METYEPRLWTEGLEGPGLRTSSGAPSWIIHARDRYLVAMLPPGFLAPSTTLSLLFALDGLARLTPDDTFHHRLILVS